MKVANRIDLTGKRFNRLKVKSFHHQNDKYKLYWECDCDCGNKKVIEGSAMKSGLTESCGCLNIELSTQRINEHRTKHGFSNKERLYETWKNMKRRCYDKNNKRYENYGGKGVIVCSEWLSDYLNFREWALSNGYESNLTIDRMNVNGNYEPKNCRWATAKQQANNQTRNRILTHEGISRTMSEWAVHLNVTYSTINHRIQRGWNMERIVNTPMKKCN